MSRFLDDFAVFLKTQSFDIIRVSEIHNDGKIETYSSTPANPCQNTYSVAKMFTMTAIGLLYDKGLLSLDEKVCDILADELPLTGMDERWYLSTVETALSHRLGLPGGFLDIDTTKSSLFGEDYLRYMLTYPLVYTPGSQSMYSDGAYYLLSRIVEKKAGIPLDNFLWKELLYKMDFQELAWSRCPMGHAMGATGLYITSEDMVKLGYLYLSGGIYRGKRLLSETWVRTAIEKEFSIDHDSEKKYFCKGGMRGQILMFLPSQNRALALQSYGADTSAVADWVKNYRD